MTWGPWRTKSPLEFRSLFPSLLFLTTAGCTAETWHSASEREGDARSCFHFGPEGGDTYRVSVGNLAAVVGRRLRGSVAVGTPDCRWGFGWRKEALRQRCEVGWGHAHRGALSRQDSARVFGVRLPGIKIKLFCYKLTRHKDIKKLWNLERGELSCLHSNIYTKSVSARWAAMTAS